MEKATWILVAAVALFSVVLTAMLLQSSGLAKVAEGVAELDLGEIKQGALLFTIGAAMLTALGMLVTILKNQR